MGMAIAATGLQGPPPELVLGNVCPTYEAEIVEQQTGSPVESGEPGELRIRGPGVSAGYFGTPTDVSGPFRDGWYYTGDMVRWGGAGQLFLVGRQHDMIKSRGFKVFPVEVETIIRQYPGVRDVAVVGVVDAEWGETVAAAVVQVVGGEIATRELLRFCRDKLESYKIPRIIRFLPDIPREITGKISRARLSLLLVQKESQQ